MSKATILFFLSLISIVTLKNLKNKGLFKKHGEACWLLSWCKGNLTCVDYRCLYKEEKAVHVKQEWSPKGLKCNFFHHCQSGYKCVKNYCKLKNSTESNDEFNEDVLEMFGIDGDNDGLIEPTAINSYESDDNNPTPTTTVTATTTTPTVTTPVVTTTTPTVTTTTTTPTVTTTTPTTTATPTVTTTTPTATPTATTTTTPTTTTTTPTTTTTNAAGTTTTTAKTGTTTGTTAATTTSAKTTGTTTKAKTA